MKEKKQKDPGKKKTARIVVGSIFGVFALFVLTVVMITVIGNKALIKRAKSYDPAVIENQLVPEKDENGYWTFTTDRDLKVMQLTDIHIGGGWLSLKQDAQALNAVATMIQAEKPDLVVVTGDMAFPVFFKAGTFNNLLSAREFAALMERLGVYWTVAFGNHDSEIYSYYSREKVADFYGSPEFKYCLFQKGPDDVDGYGNQIINVKNSKGLLTQSIYIFDSHSYTDGDYFGIMWKYDNIHDNQIEWYRDNVNLMNKQNNARLKELGMPEDSDVKSIAFFHIPLPEQRTAWYEYMANGFKDTEDVKYVYGKADSVYLSVNTDKVAVNYVASDYVVITDVDSVTTGVKNASIKTWDAAQAKKDVDSKNATATSFWAANGVSNGVYPLFNDNG